MKKEEYLRMLRDNDVFKNVLSQSKDDKERRFIKAYAEDFLMSFYNVYHHIHVETQKDPDALKKAFLEIENDLINSGSAVKP